MIVPRVYILLQGTRDRTIVIALIASLKTLSVKRKKLSLTPVERALAGLIHERNI